jgi:NTP pyrophosphohydrolases containing a Zn-finger, probably nucleic-acid-binding
MYFSNIYKRFVPSVNRPDDHTGNSIVFVADSDQLLVKASEDEIIFPGLDELRVDLSVQEEPSYMGTIDGRHSYFIPYDNAMGIPDGMVFKSLRLMLDMLDDDMGLIASRAVHLAGWSKKNKYCGVCGSITNQDSREQARRCPSCGNVIYPKISPAIIIAVVKDDKLLLAHNKNFRQRWYSTVAGFIEAGESIEACAEREVFEEVGIKIKNIRYLASQPWPFPDSLMIGLTADYAGGEVTPDGVEIDDADFFSVDALPETPGTISVAGRLIEWFIKTYQK